MSIDLTSIVFKTDFRKLTEYFYDLHNSILDKQYRFK